MGVGEANDWRRRQGVAGVVLATMAEGDEEEGDEDRTGEGGEVEQVFGSLRYLYFGWNSSLRRYSVVAPRSDELPSWGKRPSAGGYTSLMLTA